MRPPWKRFWVRPCSTSSLRIRDRYRCHRLSGFRQCRAQWIHPPDRPADIPPGRESAGRQHSLLEHVSVEAGYEAIAGCSAGKRGRGRIHRGSRLPVHRPAGIAAAVTRNGDMIDQNGVLVGGSREKLAGILSKKQEIRDLEQKGERKSRPTSSDAKETADRSRKGGAGGRKRTPAAGRGPEPDPT
jgi:hypothetical protein